MRVHIEAVFLRLPSPGEYHKMTARHVLESGEGREVSEDGLEGCSMYIVHQ